VIDREGATLDTFDQAEAAREAVRALIREDADAADGFAVLRYVGGRRIGPPISARNFLRPTGSHGDQIVRWQTAPATPEIHVAYSVTKSGEIAVMLKPTATPAEVVTYAQRRRRASSLTTVS
jgi:hypothetical protein